MINIDDGEKGDVITATMRLEGVDFRSAVTFRP